MTQNVDSRSVFRTWWPLAGSWVLMGLELPLVSAVMARLAYPEISLAAFGGVVFPVSLFIEGPVIMLLAASTTLSRDADSYRLIQRVMMIMGLGLTVLHMLIAFTPLFDLVVGKWIGPPDEVLPAARTGLIIMTPWTWSIAYRRFTQGILIRFGSSRSVVAGTLVRLGTTATVLTVGGLWGRFDGIVVGCAAVAMGVVAEAAAVGVWARPIIRKHLLQAAPAEKTLTLKAFGEFYVPLALTTLITLTGMPAASAAISRMPVALASLAVMPAIHGVTFMLRSLGFSYNEVVLSLLERKGAYDPLKKFAAWLAAATSSVVLIMAVTPLGGVYFAEVVSLSHELASLAETGLWLVIVMPALSVIQHFLQGLIVHSRKTVLITESVVVNLGTMFAVLGAGLAMGTITGLYVGLMGYVAGNLAQVFWLFWRGAKARRRAKTL